jgi:formamidopyrimidine-DNA glycosylase
MPELPEVETTVRGLRQVLEGAQLTRIEPRRADLRWPIPVDLRQRLTGARVTGLDRRAKYGLIHTDRDDTLIFHLGMSGRWRIDPAEIGKHDHLVIETEAGRVLALNDPRRFGSLDLVTTSALATFPTFAKMGPEPLGPDLNPAYLVRALATRKGPIKALLLNQAIIAGLGNIYVCEALNIARIAPDRAGGAVKPAEIKRLITAIQDVLTSAIAAGGSTLRDYAAPSGELGYFFKQWRVYGRTGEPCPCGGTVLRRAEGGRSTFYCAKCQR